MSLYIKKKVIKRSSRGFVLLIVLVFMQIFAVMGLYGLLNAKLLQKENQQRRRHEALDYIANQAIDNLEKTNVSSLPCVILPNSQLDLANLPLSWWQQQACHMTNAYYVIEPLGVDPCATITYGNTEKKQADYYRITMLTTEDRTQLDKRVIQITIIQAIDGGSVCHQREHGVTEGKQMWRRLM